VGDEREKRSKKFCSKKRKKKADMVEGIDESWGERGFGGNRVAGQGGKNKLQNNGKDEDVKEKTGVAVLGSRKNRGRRETQKKKSREGVPQGVGGGEQNQKKARAKGRGKIKKIAGTKDRKVP